MNYVAVDSAARSCPNGTVANISLGGGASAAVNSAARNLVGAGVFVAVAAGGSADDAAYYSPASEPLVCTVAAATQVDAKSSSSNYGAVVDLFAPGQSILTTWLRGGTVSCTYEEQLRHTTRWLTMMIEHTLWQFICQRSRCRPWCLPSRSQGSDDASRAGRVHAEHCYPRCPLGGSYGDQKSLGL